LNEGRRAPCQITFRITGDERKGHHCPTDFRVLRFIRWFVALYRRDASCANLRRSRDQFVPMFRGRGCRVVEHCAHRFGGTRLAAGIERRQIRSHESPEHSVSLRQRSMIPPSAPSAIAPKSPGHSVVLQQRSMIARFSGPKISPPCNSQPRSGVNTTNVSDNRGRAKRQPLPNGFSSPPVHPLVIWRRSAVLRPAIAIWLSRRLYVGVRGASKYFERNLFRPCASPRDFVWIGRLTRPNGRRAQCRQAHRSESEIIREGLAVHVSEFRSDS
jgi:hypothetical protein